MQQSAVTPQARMTRGLAALASLKLTLAALLWLALAVAWAYERSGTGAATGPLVGPLALLAINLLAAIASNRSFRRQPALLVFHLALLALVLLVLAGRLSALRGAAEVTTGGEFAGLTFAEAGPFHLGALDAVHFENLGFAIRYAPGRVRQETVNRVRWIDESGVPLEAEIGDDKPLVLHGYRFYTTHNKGFAPVFLWLPRTGAAQRGAVHLPAYPAYEEAQEQRWRVPGGPEFWILLELAEPALDPAAAGTFPAPVAHRVVARSGAARAVLAPGDRFELPEGVLVYQGLSTWMGYAVFYDWTLSWLAAAATVAVAALVWYFWPKYFSRWSDF